jgi:hypothetical protein
LRGADRDPAVIDRALAPDSPAGETIRLEAAAMDREGELVSVEKGKGTVGLFTNGSVTGSLDCPNAGMHAIALVAGGTPCKGGWPLVEIRVNGRLASLVSLTEKAVRPYPALADFPAGKCAVKIAFVNDASGKGEDRNLFLQALVVSKAPWKEAGGPGGPGIEVLTLPAAVAVIQGRAGGRLVIDGVRWDTTDANQVKGDRYASVLLGNLGASFDPPRAEPDWVPAMAFDPVTKMDYFSKEPGEARFGSSGEASARFECVKSGRYDVLLRGHADPAKGVFGIAEVKVDGVRIGEAELRSRSDRDFPVGVVPSLSSGFHAVSVRFTNDEYNPPEDRNLYLEAVGFSLR